MCGILGYLGCRDSAPIVQKGLKKLNYRGYDSWGFGFKYNGKIDIIKEIGDFEKVENVKNSGGNCAIAHSRWATTGKVSKENAHPHATENNEIVVVHNGIIENFQELKKELLKNGHEFKSETDTEIIGHLIEENFNGDFPEAVRKSFLQLKGRNAVVAMHKDFTGLIGVKNGSPLIIGIKNNSQGEEYFIASDSRAFTEETNKVIFLEDNELAILK